MNNKENSSLVEALRQANQAGYDQMEAAQAQQGHEAEMPTELDPSDPNAQALRMRPMP